MTQVLEFFIIGALNTNPEILMTKRNHLMHIAESTGKSFSEALIFGIANPQYDKRLFIDLPVQYMTTASSEHDVDTNCFLI